MSKKAQEAARHEAAMKAAVDGAKRLFVTHERDRKLAENTDKASSDAERFTQAREELRLKQELQRYKEVFEDIAHVRRLALSEHEKHTAWERLVDVSWLPNPTNEADINAFLQDWRDSQDDINSVRNNSDEVTIRLRDRQVLDSHWMRADQPITKEVRRERIDDQLNQCLLAVQLAEQIQREADLALLKARSAVIDNQRQYLTQVYEQILLTLEKVTGVVLQYLDVFLEPAEEFLTRMVPSRRSAIPPTIKYGLYVVVTDKDRTRFQRIAYQDLSISIDPKDPSSRQLPKNMTTRLPKTAVRVMQLNFDPLTVLAPLHQGQHYYALDCVFIAELVQLPERTKQVADWGCRSESSSSAVPAKEPYRPTDGSRSDEWAVKFSFQVPENIVLRTRSPLIGKWIPGDNCWEPCGTAQIVTEIGVRKVTFLAAELTTMALIQEKGFDVPYDAWQLYPTADDEAMLVIDCRKRGEPSSDRQVRIQIRESLCRLVAPEDKELAALRAQWLNPATLIRLLGQAGFNFSLCDADAAFVPNVLPKSTTMEAKGYQDIASFCCVHAFSHSRHNKYGEDAEMTLFRISKAQRPFGADRNWFSTTCEGETDEWHAIRYEKHRCAIAQFKEAEEEPTLSNAVGKETHLNLFTLLESEYGAESVQHRPMESNQLLQTAVFQLLSVIRPFTWG